MTEIRRHEDGSLIIDQDGHGWSTAWLTPVHDDTRPAALAEVCIDNTDHEVTLGRPELLAIREWIDKRLARNPIGEAVEPGNYEHGLQDAGMAALPYINPARTIDLMRALAVLAGNLPAAAADIDGDRIILDRAREILRRHGHGISASCTPTCQRHDAQAGMREPTYAALHEWPPLPVAPVAPTRYARGHVRRDAP